MGERAINRERGERKGEARKSRVISYNRKVERESQVRKCREKIESNIKRESRGRIWREAE